MKRKNSKLYLCSLGLLLALGACEKYLNLAPENSTYDGVFWTDAANISRAKAGAYSMLRNALRADRSFFIFGDLAAGNFRVGGDYWNYNSLVKSGGFTFSYAPYLEASLWNWTRFYQVINQCNLTIEKTSEIPEGEFSGGLADKNRHIAETRFVRAFVNFYMQRVWGDILLVRESYSDPQNIPPIARAPQEETLAFCIADLNHAIEHLDNSGSKAVASKGAAQALLAHVYAWQHDYAKAEQLANDVINAGYSLESMQDYRKIWAGASKETIFEINMLYSTSGSEFSQNFFNAFLTAPTVRGKSSGSAWYLDPDMVQDYFAESEARFDSISRQPGSDPSAKLLRKYDNVNYYLPNNTRTYAVSNNLVVLRLADIQLLRAEAYFKNGKEALALNDLNTIRQRAGLPNVQVSGDDLFIEIFRERRRELIGEGCTQFDLIRMELLDKLAEYSDHYSAVRIANQGYHWPLNMRDLLPQNELLTQNPWWKNN